MTSGPEAAYQNAARPFTRPVRWVLTENSLREESKSTRTIALATVKTVRLTAVRGGLGGAALRVSDGRQVMRLTSRGFEGVRPAEHAAIFSPFARALCAAARRASPNAVFEAGESKAAGILGGIAAIIGAGMAMMLLAIVALDAAALGLEFAARLSFLLLLILAAWPWVGTLGVRRFDPLAMPADLLP